MVQIFSAYHINNNKLDKISLVSLYAFKWIDNIVQKLAAREDDI